MQKKKKTDGEVPLDLTVIISYIGALTEQTRYHLITDLPDRAPISHHPLRS